MVGGGGGGCLTVPVPLTTGVGGSGRLELLATGGENGLLSAEAGDDELSIPFKADCHDLRGGLLVPVETPGEVGLVAAKLDFIRATNPSLSRS
jgi:hypothetical protein